MDEVVMIFGFYRVQGGGLPIHVHVYRTQTFFLEISSDKIFACVHGPIKVFSFHLASITFITFTYHCRFSVTLSFCLSVSHYGLELHLGMAKNDNNNDITYYYVLQLHNSINVINSYSNWTDKKTT